MIPIIGHIANAYHYIFIEIADPRTNDWFLIKHPIVWLVIIGYIYWVTVVGPRYMKYREPFQLKEVLIVYNFIQVLVSIYLFKEGFHYGWFNGYSFRCQPVDFSNDPKALRAANACFYYYMAKISELLDTVFFVLRKKDNQVTLLHVYHHTIMPLLSWGATKYYPGGHGTFIGFINSFTHIIMYFYYMLAAMGPPFQKYLWWKKYITTIQLTQFCMIFIHGMQLFIYECEFPSWTAMLVLPNVIFFYYLFSNFYKSAYSLTRRKHCGEERAVNTVYVPREKIVEEGRPVVKTKTKKFSIQLSLRRRNK